MASLVEELVSVLEAEEEKYQALIECGTKKREAVIAADVTALEQLTAREQLISDDLMSLGNRQIQTLKDIATVLGKSPEEMTVTRLIECLDTQPEARGRLTKARDRLLAAAKELKGINDENIVLIQQAIELNEFDLTLFKSLRQAPETANYDKNAYNTGALLGSSGFDATS